MEEEKCEVEEPDYVMNELDEFLKLMVEASSLKLEDLH